MKTECPYCRQHYEVDNEYIGQIVKCVTCGRGFVVAALSGPGGDSKTNGLGSNAADDTRSIEAQNPGGKKKALVCEMCGSTDLIKQNGVFVCQTCGIKYSMEEARKMMADSSDNVIGTVKVDISEKLKKLYTLARRAKEENNCENAEKYYGLILLEDPESWEASFYQVYFKAMGCKIIEIASAAAAVERCLKNVLYLIAREPNREKRYASFSEVTDRATDIAAMFDEAASKNFADIDAEVKNQFVQGYVDSVLSSAQICYTLGDLLSSVQETELAGVSWKTAINIHVDCFSYITDKKSHKVILEEYAAKIRRFEPDYKMPSTGGCYIATAVYGSYDCPEVWTLRRFRDFRLGRTWYGRLFIRTYYAVSPRLVKHFGHTRMFQIFWRRKLDKLVRKLNDQGVSDSPYVDRSW